MTSGEQEKKSWRRVKIIKTLVSSSSLKTANGEKEFGPLWVSGQKRTKPERQRQRDGGNMCLPCRMVQLCVAQEMQLPGL